MHDRASSTRWTLVLASLLVLLPAVGCRAARPEPGADGASAVRAPGPRPAPAPERWLPLIGEYGAADDPVVHVLEDGARLHLLAGDGTRQPLEELGSSRFRVADGARAGAELVFARDESGRVTRLRIGERVLPRRATGAEDGATFRITPQRPPEELRREALSATPPDEAGDFREPALVELVRLDPALRLDIRYATTNNFMGAVFYREPRAFLQRPAAEALARAHRWLRERGYGLLIHDAYRPWYVTRMFWDATPPELRHFVADPARGSRHNRGAAVDLTLVDLATGEPVPMPSGYDEFTPRAHPDYPGGTALQRWHRDLLRAAMEAHGFTVYEEEWWHFDHADWRRYPILNLTFDQIAPAGR